MMDVIPAEPKSRLLAGPREERLLTAFFVLYKTARIIEENNATFKRQTAGFARCLEECSDEGGKVHIKIISSRYFINDRMVRFDDRGLSGAAAVVSEWDSLGVGGVRFASDIEHAEIEQFFTFMAQVKPNSENLESLSEHLKAYHMSSVQLLSRTGAEDKEAMVSEEIRREFRRGARSTFFKAMSVVKEVMVNTKQERDINISKTKRVVHSLIDHITRDEASLIELTAIKDFDDYTYAHCTNVCVYALTLGVRLGLDRARLSQLGMTALFHDIGKVKLPTDLIRKPQAYDENDWIQMQTHPHLGAKTILRNLTFDTHAARAARGALEHHVNKDFTGYPMLRRPRSKKSLNLFSKIISIVDTFDALTSGRIYIRKPIPPEDVLKKMHYQMNVKFDGFLLKIFNDIVGIYPAGSVVLLSTDEIALVLTNSEHDKARPYVKIVGNKQGILEQPEWADLSAEDNAHRVIVRRIDPTRYGLDVKHFIMCD
ncbi:MAG: HD domain-containing protein [Candidatus Zixiibacteriota bacterium]|nr:MAG: HD domain-containing protein [candidate division Zixibacteria bacterium]